MAYYVTGMYKQDNELGYYIFDSESEKAAKVSNKMFIDIPSIAKDLINARLISNASLNKYNLIAKRVGFGTSGEYKPAIIEEDKIIEDNMTLVYLDYNTRKFGLVNYDGTNIVWESFDRLSSMSNNTLYNNIQYYKKTGTLSYKAYHIIGDYNAYEIKLEGLMDRDLALEDKSNEVNNGYRGFDSKLDIHNRDEETQLVKMSNEVSNNIKDELSKVELVESNMSEQAIIDNRLQNIIGSISSKDSEYATKKLDITKKDFYEISISMLRDYDIITIPKWILKEIKFKIQCNLETSMNLDRMVSIGTIELSNRDKEKLLVIVKQSEDDEFIKLQMVMGYTIEEGKNYSIEYVKEEYNKWRANKKYLSL